MEYVTDYTLREYDHDDSEDVTCLIHPSCIVNWMTDVYTEGDRYRVALKLISVLDDETVAKLLADRIEWKPFMESLAELQRQVEELE